MAHFKCVKTLPLDTTSVTGAGAVPPRLSARPTLSVGVSLRRPRAGTSAPLVINVSVVSGRNFNSVRCLSCARIKRASEWRE